MVSMEGSCIAWAMAVLMASRLEWRSATSKQKRVGTGERLSLKIEREVGADGTTTMAAPVPKAG